MRRDLEFKTEDGLTLRGWLYLPDAGSGPAPTVVMAHGFSAVKEMYLDRFGEVFADAGLGALMFDYRNTGASEGKPRQHLDPWEQVGDYRDAITYASTLPEVDEERIGVWGSSYSGGHVLVVGAIDRRVKCVASQVMLISGPRLVRRLVRADQIAALRDGFVADRKARYAGEPPGMIPVVTDDPAGAAVLPTRDSFEWFMETAKARAPSWRNEVTLQSVELFTEYEPGAYIPYISPTPLLMVIADRDHLAVADEAFAAYEQAREPKKLVVLQGGHFDAYVNGGFAVTSAAARDWFVQHLGQRGS